MFCSNVYIGSASSLMLVTFITSMPYLCVGTLLRSRTLFGSLSFTSHEVDAFIGMFAFEGICVFNRVSSVSFFVTGPGLVSSFSSVAFELISMIGVQSSFSRSIAISGALPFLFLGAFRASLVTAHCHLSWLFQPVLLVFCFSCCPVFPFAPP